MTVSTGDRLPSATFIEIGPDGPATVTTDALFAGRKVVLFAVPGAYTPTCQMAHVPSFMRNAKALTDKGVDEIVCVSVNDPFVLKAWGEATGAKDAGIRMLSDAGSEFTKAIGMDFTAPPVGLIARSKRYAMLIDDGVVTVLNLEASPGECDISSGERMIEAI